MFGLMMGHMTNLTATEEATIHRASLIELGWECGPVEIVADGAQFAVVQPSLTIGTGRRARVSQATRQVRHFDGRTMTITVMPRNLMKAGNVPIGTAIVVDGRIIKVASRVGVWLPKKNGRMHGVRLVCDDGTELLCTSSKRLEVA